MKLPAARLVLEDGSVYTGRAFGAAVDRTGEVVFNTSMAGYQEILTDPSYTGQIIAMTYPLIGNYGVNPGDVESNKPQVDGFIVRELSAIRSNYRSQDDLSGYLSKAGVPGIEGIDTRALTRKLRTAGVMRGVLACSEASAKQSDADLVDRARSSPKMEGTNLAAKVSCKESYDWKSGFIDGFTNNQTPHDAGAIYSGPRFKVVCVDYGVKTNILRCLVDIGADVTVVPATATAADVFALKPDGVFLSNGPGDPAAVTGAPELIRGLAGKTPLFGICLGHQLMGLAFGGQTYKLKFGHRGANQPVFETATGKVEITSQNHGFAVNPDTLSKDHVEVTHVNLNDKTVEGLSHKDIPAFSVQYHPEASPGPHDSFYLFGRFREMILKHGTK
ncbi:MAG: glutamine-hydrolyzing carbamoyl-phosphate synthase small subunit [Planctomycetota bacterium]